MEITTNSRWESKKNGESAAGSTKRAREKPAVQHTTEIMSAMKEMFRDVIQTAMEVEQIGRAHV